MRDKRALGKMLRRAVASSARRASARRAERWRRRCYFAYLEVVRDTTLRNGVLRPLPSPAQLRTLLAIREHLSPRAQALIDEVASRRRVRVSLLDEPCAVDLHVDAWPAHIHSSTNETCRIGVG